MAAIGSSTAQTIELETPAPTWSTSVEKSSSSVPYVSEGSRPLGTIENSTDNGSPALTRDDEDNLPPPPTSHDVVARWNESQGNIFRFLACLWSLLVSGANDAAYGALIPYLEDYYNLSYLIVSLVFLSPFVGYVASASMNNWLHLKIGQRGIAISCGIAHAAAFIIIAQHPPYPVLVVAYAIVGFGNGVADAAWNAWVGNLANSSELLGLLHACYGVGGTISPWIATSMITKAKLGWHTFYYVLLGMAVLELVTLTLAFWSKTAEHHRVTVHGSNDANSGSTRTALFQKPYARITWLCAFFLLAYVGVEVSLGGWIVQFMLKVRDAKPYDAGMSSVGFWLGITLGRVVLGFATPKIGVKLSLSIFLPLTMALELVFWLVPQFYVSAVAVALQGFFLGPVFPTTVLAATKLLPRRLHVSTIGFAAAFGGSGAAVLPFIIGAVSQAKGVKVLQPIILAILGVMLVLWLCLPRIGKKTE